MIGPGQIDTKIKNGQLVKNIYQNFFLDFNFLSFNNVFSIYKNTNNAISSTMAFNSSPIYNQNYHESIFDKFTKWKITQNDFFAQNKDKKILSIKNKALNYCDKNVDTCLRLNSENQNSSGINNFFYKDAEYLTYNLSKNNSIIGNFILRISRFFGYRKINTFSLDKIFFKKNLEKLTSVINNTNFDIYFFHFLVPHSPFGFNFKKKDQECSYIHFDKKITNANEILEQHYKEIACTISLLKNFMQSINNLDNITFLLISDTGFPVKEDVKSSHQVLYAIKNLKENDYNQNIQISSQKLFSMHFNKKHKDLHLSEKNYYFDREEKKYKPY